MPAPRSFKQELVGAFGCPIAENPTQAMIEPAFRALGLDWRYLTVEVRPDDRRDARSVQWEGEYQVPADTGLLVNATSIGLSPDVHARVPVAAGSFRPGLLACDVIPNPPRTRFLAEAEARGCDTLDGLGMLVNQ